MGRHGDVVASREWLALDYPGAMLARSAMLTSTGLSPWPSSPGRALRGRSPVLSIGSNATPSVLRRKLLTAGVSPDVLLTPALVLGIGVAHSAHVSLGGYVAATPLHRRGQASRGVLGWFDLEQVEALDTSEPNYVRSKVDASVYPVSVVDGPTPFRFELYRSVWGVLCPSGHALAMRPQRTLLRLLAEDPTVAAVLPLHDPASLVATLRDPQVQEWLRLHWARTGQVGLDGLVCRDWTDRRPLVGGTGRATQRGPVNSRPAPAVSALRAGLR